MRISTKQVDIELNRKGELKMKCLCGCGQDPKRGKLYVEGHNALSEEHKRKLFEGRAKWVKAHPEEARMSIANNLKKYMETHPDFYKKRSKMMSKRMSGKNHPMFGRKHSAETRAKLSKATTSYMEKHPEFVKEKVRQMVAGNPPGHHSRVLKELYKNPEWHDRVLSPQMHSRKMSSYEQRVLGLIKKYNLPYKFVGNGEVWIGQKNPDFINTNGEKKIIEVYSEYHVGFWKDKDYESERSKLFAKYGFQTIFLTEKDLFVRNWAKKCLNKI